MSNLTAKQTCYELNEEELENITGGVDVVRGTYHVKCLHCYQENDFTTEAHAGVSSWELGTCSCGAKIYYSSTTEAISIKNNVSKTCPMTKTAGL